MEDTKPKRKKVPGSGRKKGVPNKYSGELRGDVRDVLVANFPEFVKKLSELEGLDYIDVYIKLLKIVLPGLQAVDINAKVQGETSIQDHLASLLTPDGEATDADL